MSLRLDRANRHGLVAGATGTGKTVTLQVLAQGFSDAGVPVFAADVKGDLSGISAAGTPNEMRVSDAGVAPMFCTTNLPHHPPLHEESTCTRMLTLPGAGAGHQMIGSCRQ